MISLTLAVLLASAPSEWLDKREMLKCEAERLRTAYQTHLARVDEPAEAVTIPLDTYEDGSVKMIIVAKKAQLFAREDFVLAWDLVIRKLDEKGVELSRVEAERCLVDRATKSGWCDGPVRIANEKTTFTGENVYFSSLEGYVMSLTKSKLVSTDMKLGGAL